jgi:hypothetical protein
MKLTTGIKKPESRGPENNFDFFKCHSQEIRETVVPASF